jgi:hypothetical protein
LATGRGHRIPFIKLVKIHVQCTDTDDKPMAGRAYKIVLPRGQEVQGELDGDGWAKHDGIYPGECTFTLLEEGEALVPVPQDREEPDAQYHLRLRFEDENGAPFVNKPFEFECGDVLVEGMTDDTGKLVADVPTSATNGEVTIWLDADKSGESYAWPLRISDVAN